MLFKHLHNTPFRIAFSVLFAIACFALMGCATNLLVLREPFDFDLVWHLAIPAILGVFAAFVYTPEDI